ncbi:helix-turn-helix domain-containing protein [Burkholderia multivorans]|uniref:S24 family peptidase n=1 Tax=Burkholderia multivorans TaxID=87883 RepID=UPI001C266DFA|nr:S24 family peptidase [Burkholderia multivorans]MBU9549919.1 helix-turn-helix domain-containing protein [Burkholderia multivorans]
MKTIAQIRLDNVLRLVENRNMTKADLARRIGISPQQVYQLLSYKRNIGAKLARKIESAFDKEPGWLDQDHPYLTAATLPESSLSPETSNIRHLPARPVLAWDNEDELPHDEYVLVPRLAVKASAGNGKLVWQVDEKGQRQAFRKAWLERLGMKPEYAATIVADGMSMAPRIEDGDSLVVNYKEHTITSGKVYVFTFAYELFIKRLYRGVDAVRVVSDNPDKSRYPDWEIPAERLHDLTVIARVVAVSGAI